MTAVRESVLSTTLSFLGPEEPEGPYTIRTGQLLRLLTRQLYGYRAGEVVPAPDVALEVPTVANGGVSEDGRTYRLRLRRGVFWDAQGARELTAGDVVRGLKRVALPTAAHARRYFTNTIDGMRDYCAAFEARFGDDQPTAPDLAQFQFSHDVAGLSAPDNETVVIRLAVPANDFLHILATGVAAAAPREYDYYLADSPALLRNAPSAGPYRIAGSHRISRTQPRGRDLLLEPNPRWNPDTDSVREQVVDAIRIGAGADGYDLAWPFTTMSWAAGEDVVPAPSRYGLGPYLVVNVAESQRGGPLAQPAVRRAIACAVNRAAVRDAVTAVPGVTAAIQHGLLPPGSLGAGEVEPVAPDTGDPDRARRELASAGYPDGVGLVLAVQDTELDRRAAVAVRDGLARAGIRVDLLDQAHGRLRSTSWDLALDSHPPDWYGNNARTSVEPLVRGGAEPGSANLGGYHNPVVNRLMNYALRDPNPARAAELWQKVEALVLADLPIVPLLAHACGPCTAAAGAPPRLRWFAG